MYTYLFGRWFKSRFWNWIPQNFGQCLGQCPRAFFVIEIIEIWELDEFRLDIVRRYANIRSSLKKIHEFYSIFGPSPAKASTLLVNLSLDTQSMWKTITYDSKNKVHNMHIAHPNTKIHHYYRSKCLRNVLRVLVYFTKLKMYAN